MDVVVRLATHQQFVLRRYDWFFTVPFRHDFVFRRRLHLHASHRRHLLSGRLKVYHVSMKAPTTHRADVGSHLRGLFLTDATTASPPFPIRAGLIFLVELFLKNTYIQPANPPMSAPTFNSIGDRWEQDGVPSVSSIRHNVFMGIINLFNDCLYCRLAGSA